MSAASQVPNAPEDARELTGPGHLLRSAREAANVNLRDISAQLHLDERTVDSLERDDFQNLPAPTFVRGYLRGYARLLNVPVGPVMEAYDREGFRPPDLVADIAEAPDTEAADFPVRLVTWAVVIVLGAMVVVWWNNTNQDFSDLTTPTTIEKFGFPAAESDPSDGTQNFAEQPATPGGDTSAQGSSLTDSTEPMPVSTAGSDTPTRTASSDKQDVEPPADALPATSQEPPPVNQQDNQDPSLVASRRADEVLAEARRALTQSRDAVQTSAGSSEALGAASTLPAAATSAPASAPTSASVSESAATAVAAVPAAVPNDGATADQGRLVIKFATEAWVEVYDRDETKLFYNLAKPGQEVQVSGPTPMRVLLGRTRGVEVRFNDQPVNVTPFIEKGVARFTLPN